MAVLGQLLYLRRFPEARDLRYERSDGGEEFIWGEGFGDGEVGAEFSGDLHVEFGPDGAALYCKVEGVTWLDDRRLAFVSDEADKGVCRSRDQSIHVFRLPD